MKEERLLLLLSGIDGDLLRDAVPAQDPITRRPRSGWLRWGSLAACLALLCGCVAFLWPHNAPTPDTEDVDGLWPLSPNSLPSFMEAGNKGEAVTEPLIYVESIEDDTQSAESQPTDGHLGVAPNEGKMTDISIRITSPSGEPVRNLAIRAEHLSGGQSSFYMPGYAMTDATGCVTRGLQPNNTYRIYLQRVNALTYGINASTQVLCEITYDVLISDDTNQIELIWDEDTATAVSPVERRLTLELLDSTTNAPVEDLFVQAVTPDGGTQLQIGYTDKNGKLDWCNPTNGTYLVMVAVMAPDRDGYEVYAHYEVEVTDDCVRSTLFWTGESDEGGGIFIPE